MTARTIKASEARDVLAEYTNEQLAEFARNAKARGADFARLAAAHQSNASRYTKELRRRARAAKRGAP